MILVDLIIVLILGAYAYLGYRSGFINQGAELVLLVVSFTLALVLYQPVSGLFTSAIQVPGSIVRMIVFLIIWLGFEFGFGFAWRYLRKRIPKDLHKKPVNHFAGIGVGLTRGTVLVGIVLLIVASAPLTATAKDPVLNSGLGKPFLAIGTGFQQQFNNLFGNALKDTLAFKTIRTESNESADLGFRTTAVKVCRNDEAKMLQLLNSERQKEGLRTLTEDPELREVARAHSRDMLARGYFSHVTPDGADPFDRMERAGISYTYAGENLAFAPTVDIAHTGLMNSPGHRANILKPEFKRVGIGCIDAGFRGKMFSQEFKG